MGFGKPQDVYRAGEVEKVRHIRARLQEILDYVEAEGLTLPVRMRINERGKIVDLEIKDKP